MALHPGKSQQREFSLLWEVCPCVLLCVPSQLWTTRPRGTVFFLEVGEKEQRAACVWREVVLAGRGCFLTCQGLCRETPPQSHFVSGDQSRPFSLASPSAHRHGGLCAAGCRRIGTPDPCRGCDTYVTLSSLLPHTVDPHLPVNPGSKVHDHCGLNYSLR